MLETQIQTPLQMGSTKHSSRTKRLSLIRNKFIIIPWDAVILLSVRSVKLQQCKREMVFSRNCERNSFLRLNFVSARIFISRFISEKVLDNTLWRMLSTLEGCHQHFKGYYLYWGGIPSVLWSEYIQYCGKTIQHCGDTIQYCAGCLVLTLLGQ